MVTVLLIRHGHRIPGPDGPDVPLSSVGLEAVDQLAQSVARCGVAPRLLLTSAWTHAKQTAELLRNAVAPGAPIVAVASLTPHTTTHATLHSLLSQTAADLDLAGLDCFGCVGHEARLAQLTKDLTGLAVAYLEYGTARHIVAGSFEELLASQGTVHGLLPGANEE